MLVPMEHIRAMRAIRKKQGETERMAVEMMEERNREIENKKFYRRALIKIFLYADPRAKKWSSELQVKMIKGMARVALDENFNEE